MMPESNEDPFVEFRPGYIPKENPTPTVQSTKDFSLDSDDPFEEFRPKEKENEPFKENVKRQATQYASRAAERVAGTPKDIHNFFSDLIIDSYEKASLGFNTESKKLRDAPDWLKNSLKYSSGLSQKLPSSKQLEEASIKYSKGYTEPKNKTEKRIGEIVGDVTSALTGGRTRGRFIQNKILTPLAANLAEEGIEMFSGDKESANKAKMATFFTLGLGFNANANKFAGNLINQGEQAMGQTPVNINSLRNNLQPLKRQFLHGDPNSTSASSQINSIVHDIQNGKASATDLTGRVRAINTEIEKLGGFQIGPNERRTQTRNLNKVKDAVYKTLEDSMQNNPDAFQTYMSGQNAWSSIAQSNRVLKFAKKNYGKFLSHGAAILFGDVATGHHLSGAMLHNPGKVALALGATAAITKFSQIAQRVYNNKNLRAYYLDAIKGALNDDRNVFIQNMTRLDEELRKEEERKNPPYKI